MNLARHSLSDSAPTQIIDVRFDVECRIFTCSTPDGFAIYQTRPLKLLRKHDFKDGTISTILPLHTTSLMFILGGGRSPLYPPNKVVFWDEAKSTAVAELEFRERVRGISCRRNWLAVALRHRLAVFRFDDRQITKYGEWDTCDNPRGLVAMASSPHSTVLAGLGRQVGHVQLIHLPPCPPPPLSATSSPDYKPSHLLSPPHPPRKQSVTIIVAHESSLTTLTTAPSGALLATTSHKGTLVRIWDTYSGSLIRELRRGADPAEIYGVAFRPDEQELCVWSDKGTIHVFTIHQDNKSASNRISALSPLSPYLKLPKYFQSEWSYCHFRLPLASSISGTVNKVSLERDPDAGELERCVAGWIPAESPDDGSLGAAPEQPFELVALTYTGGWYRLILPQPSHTRAPDSQSQSTRSSLHKGKGRDSEEKAGGRTCTVAEYRHYGRWDGWG